MAEQVGSAPPQNPAWLRSALDAGRVVTWDHDLRSGRISRSDNVQAVFGVADTAGDFADRIHPDDRACRDAAVQAALAARGDYRSAYRFAAQDGGWRYLEDRGVVLADPVGRPLRIVGVSFDQTELQAVQTQLLDLTAELERRVAAATVARLALEEQLRQTQKLQAVGQLAGGVAHDFNNLLTAVLGSLELLERHVGTEAGRRLLGAARMAAERGATLTNQLLVFARRQKLAAQTLDPAELLGRMQDMLSRTLGSAVLLRLDLAGAGWAVTADPVQLELAVLNLAINARDAMPQGGRLIIATSTATLLAPQAEALGLPAGAYVVISVADSGTGMTPEVLARAFEPFFTTKEIGRGTGLGLAQVYGAARQSGGTARMASVAGKGTTAEIWLPRADPAAGVTAPEPGAHESAILLVDDEPQVRSFAADVLREAGYRVIEAPDAAAALATLGGGASADLLVTDFLMPGQSGSALAEAARLLRPGLRVLLMSGYAELDGAEAARADAHLRKPFRGADLRAAVAELLARQPLVAPAVSPEM